jgi:serine-type D-Ala-D-Ala carboxypeptidase/endopeptidase (penicillin-binding protein 4)
MLKRIILLTLLVLFEQIGGDLLAQDSTKSAEISHKDVVAETFFTTFSHEDSSRSRKELIRDISRVFKYARMGKAQFSIAVYSLDSKEFVFKRNLKQALTPASLTKLFTSYSAFASLGSDFEITTTIWCDDDNLEDNIANGDLYFVGSGDALFAKKELDTLFSLIKKRGIKEIKGDIVIDQSYFDGEYDRFHYSGDRDRVQNLGPILPFSISRKASTKSGNLIVKVLKKYGIKFNGKVQRCELPLFDNEKKLIKVAEFKRTINELVRITNKRSDNFVAEHIFKINGANNTRFPNENSKGAEDLLYKLLDSLSIPFDGCEIHDGSGLSRRNLVTTESITLLLNAIFESDFGTNFQNTLSVAGRDGTLKGRMQLGLSDDNFRGKTGTLRNVSGLAGFVKSLDGERFAVAMIFNGNNVKYYKQLEDDVIESVAGFFYFNSIN